jgi:hypothetical protein
VQRVTSLSENIRLGLYLLVSFLESQSDDNGSTSSQTSAWFPVLDGDTVQYQCSKKGNVFVRLIPGNTERSPSCNIL